MARTVKLTAAEFREKHARRLKGAVDDIRLGVDRVVDAPGVKAAAKKDKWIQNLSKQETVDKWARRVAAVPLDDWKAQMINKGIGRIAAGIDAAAPKVEEFAEKLIAHQNTGLAKIDAMPDLTLEDSIQRMSTWTRHMTTFKR